MHSSEPEIQVQHKIDFPYYCTVEEFEKPSYSTYSRTCKQYTVTELYKINPSKLQYKMFYKVKHLFSHKVNPVNDD